MAAPRGTNAPILATVTLALAARNRHLPKPDESSNCIERTGVSCRSTSTKKGLAVTASMHPAPDTAGLPAIDGEADAHYLSAALARAGRPRHVARLEVDRLGGGRISANVFSLRSDAGAFVLKKFMPEPWRVELFGSAFNEPALWSCGVTRELPEPLSCPTIDVAFHRQRGECWMLMDDVSHGVAPRGTFDEGVLSPAARRPRAPARSLLGAAGRSLASCRS